MTGTAQDAIMLAQMLSATTQPGGEARLHDFVGQRVKAHIEGSSATAIVVNDSNLVNMVNGRATGGTPAPRAFYTLEDAVAYTASVPRTQTNPRITVYGEHNIGRLTVSIPRLTIDGMLVMGVGMVGTLIGCLKLQASGITIKDLNLRAVDHSPCIAGDSDQRPINKVRLANVVFERDDTFNGSIDSFVENIEIEDTTDRPVPNRPRIDARLPQVGRYVFSAAAGALIGAVVYWVALFPMLVAAGGAISAGPATAVFGPLALHWSAAMGTTAFAVTGSGISSLTVLGCDLWRSFMSRSIRRSQRAMRHYIRALRHPGRRNALAPSRGSALA